MRITLLCNADIASNLAANRLIAALPHHQFTLLMTAQVGGKQAKPAALSALAFYENTLFTQILFPALANTQAPRTRKLLTFDEIRQKGIAVHQVADINDGVGLARLQQSEPDLVLSVRFGRILKQPALAVPKQGVLNLHSGLLPQYRGIMATFWSMLHQQPQMGCTLHRIQDEGIDTGDVISLHPVATDFGASYLDNLLSIYPPGIDAMIEATECIAKGETLNTQQQDNTHAGYYGMPDADAISAFEQKGYRWVDHDKLVALAKTFYEKQGD
jgi:methionyl-tRNA formyltransferase